MIDSSNGDDRARWSKRSAGRGFTLIELVVTIAVLGILATIAYPAYQEQIRKGRRPQAQAALVEMANLQQQHFSDVFRYADTRVNNVDEIGCPVPTDATLCYSPMTGNKDDPDRFYSLDITVGDATSFTVRARTAGAQVADKRCAEMTLTNTGVKASKDSGGAATTDCWRN